jgi:hypothetical protein
MRRRHENKTSGKRVYHCLYYVLSTRVVLTPVGFPLALARGTHTMHHKKVGVLARRVPAQALFQREQKHFFSASKACSQLASQDVKEEEYVRNHGRCKVQYWVLVDTEPEAARMLAKYSQNHAGRTRARPTRREESSGGYLLDPKALSGLPPVQAHPLVTPDLLVEAGAPLHEVCEHVC